MNTHRACLALILPALILTMVSSIAAQDSARIQPDQAVTPKGVVGYRIHGLRFEIVGRTKERFLREDIDISIGRVFPDRVSLEAYLADRAQLIVNERTIESATIEPIYGEVGPGGIVEVDLVAHVADTVNIIVLPYFKYDSNDGLLLSMRGRDYNFFGTMQPFKLDLNYTIDTGGDQEWEVETQFDLPFQMGGLDYEWSFDQSVAYTEDKVIRYEAKTGIDLITPLWIGELTVGPSQGLYINPDDDDDELYRGWFFKTALGSSYKIPLPVDLKYFGALYATFDVEAYDYWNPTTSVPEDWSGPCLSFTEKLSFGRVDWLGNFRRGLEAAGTLSETYNFDTAAWTDKFSGYVDGHYKFGPRLGVSGRFKIFYCFNDVEDEAGDEVRGILDSRIDTNAAIYLNLEMPFAVYRYMPHEWTGVSWLRFIALEQHWAPFFDMALTHDEETGRWFNPRDGWYGAGLEVITFPYKFRSFYVRVSAGWDIPTLIETKSLSGRSSRDGKKGRELFIGLGHQF